MSARRWPNGLGWDVDSRHGKAEVRDLVTRLRAFVPMADHVEPLPAGKRRATARHRVADYAIGTDPAAAVGDCARYGAVTNEGEQRLREVPLRAVAQTTIER